MTAPAPPPAGVPGPSGRRLRHPARWIAGAVAVVLVVVAVVLATRPQAQATKVQSPLLGQPAPAFTERSFHGSTVSLAQYRGRYVFVNFFASWCPPCQAEEPALVSFQFQQSRQPDGARLVSVVYDDPNDAARSFIDKWGARWPTIPDPGGQIASAYGVSSPPTTVLVDPRGTVAAVFFSQVTVADLEHALATARRQAAA